MAFKVKYLVNLIMFLGHQPTCDIISYLFIILLFVLMKRYFKYKIWKLLNVECNKNKKYLPQENKRMKAKLK